MDKIPTELTAEDIGLGMKNERTVIIKSANQFYNDKAVRIRTLRGREFRQITQKVHVSGENDLAGGYALAMEACKIAILSPGIVAVLDNIDHDVVLQVGQEIISASTPDEDATENFSKATTAE